MFLLAAFLALSPMALADTPSVHGMAVVGSSYLSHLPMFHAPHDYQLLLEADLGAEGKSALQASRQRHPEEPLYTLVPEKFDLAAMVKSFRPFKATLFRGHFERGGVPITGEITVKLKKTLYFQKLKAETPAPKSPTFLYFGNAQEQFLAHKISGRPDFDQLVEVITHILPPATVVELQFRPGTGPLDPGEIEAHSKAAPTKSLVMVKKSLYLEFGDLAH